MGCCGTFAKTLLIIFNIIFVLCGLALIVVGGLLLSDALNMDIVIDQIDTSLKAPQIVLIVVGVLIFVISFLGCCGAIKDSKCMLITFAVCLGVIFIIQFVIGIYAVVNFSEGSIEKVLNDIFKDRTATNVDMFDSLQEALECCGVKSSSDYGQNGWSVPRSCCPDQKCNSASDYFKEGCAEALTDWTLNAGKILGGVAIGLSIMEILGVVFAWIQVRDSRYVI